MDLDGDGWLDIVTIWERAHTFNSGKASNDTAGWTKGPSADLDEQPRVVKNSGGRSFVDISDITLAVEIPSFLAAPAKLRHLAVSALDNRPLN